MKTEAQIKARIAEIKDDERMKAKPADIHINAPLALIQCHYEGQLKALEWVGKVSPEFRLAFPISCAGFVEPSMYLLPPLSNMRDVRQVKNEGHRAGKDDRGSRYVTVLKIPPIDSALKAVQASIIAHRRV